MPLYPGRCPGLGASALSGRAASGAFGPPVLKPLAKLGLIDKSLGDVAVVLDAAVAEEWPPAAHILAVLQVDIYHQALFFLIAGTVVELALRTGYETAAPELDALGLTARIRLETYAVYGDDRQSVGYGMASHHGSPRLALALLLLLGIIGSVADGGTYARLRVC